MISIRWIVSILLMPFFWGCSIPLVRPTRIDWNSSLSPQTVQIKGHTIFYTVKGEGKPLVLIHGYGAGMWIWEKQIDVLSQIRRVYLVDLIGHGFSDRPKIDYTPDAYIHSFMGFMTAIGVEKATLIGNSMGGGLAWSVASLFPERVDKLVLIDCIPPDVLEQVQNESFKALIALERFPLLLSLAFASRNKGSIARILQECVANAALITPGVVDRQYQLTRIEGTSWSLCSTFRNAKEALRLKECLSRIDRPTLLIWGEDDLIFPLAVGETLQRTIPGSRLQIIEKSGHIPMWEKPEKANDAILTFLTD